MMDHVLRKVNLQDLMRGHKRIVLQHRDKPYHLSITRKGKLILTACNTVSDADSRNVINKNS